MKNTTSNGMKLSQVIEEYLLEHQIQGNSPATIRYYRQNLTWFLEYVGDNEVEAITLSQVRTYVLHLRERDVTSTTIQTYTRAVRGFLAWCYREDYLAEDYTKKLRLPKATRKAIDILTDDEIERLLACFDTKTLMGVRDMLITLLMLDSGLRLSEVVRLRVGKIHLESGYLIAHGKGNKERYVPLGLHTKKYLVRYLALTCLVENDQLIPLKNSAIASLFRRLKVKSNIPRLKPHLLRHTFATRYLELGGDVYNLQAILGHTTLEMVKRYVHLIPQKTAVSFSRFSPIDNLSKK